MAWVFGLLFVIIFFGIFLIDPKHYCKGEIEE
jgi:hypothetical protein